jgi:formylglycine-generating enzyme required for sulfatase activity
MISLKEAVAYCQAIGGQLPSELEWESAARRGFGSSVMTHPWLLKDRETAHDYANYGSEASTGFAEGRDRWRSAPAPIAWFPPIPETLLFDMAGNVAEWVLPPYPNPADLDILRGGSWRSSISDLRFSARLPIQGDSRDDSIGFRCVMLSPKL